MRVSYRHHFAMIVFLTLVWVLVCWRLWTPSAADRQIFLQDSDFTLHYYGPISQHIERFQQGEFMQWNPYNRGGFPQVANIQNGVFYLPRYALALFTGGNGWSIQDFQWEVMVHLWLTSVLMYAFVYRVIEALTPRASAVAVFGAIAWAYSGYLSSYPQLHVTILETVTWLPAFFLGISLGMTQPQWRWGAGITSLAFMLMILAGHPQVLLYCAYFGLFYAVYLGWAHRLGWRQTILRVGVMFGLGMGLAAVQLLPTLELMRLSSRVVDQAFSQKSMGFDLTAFLSLIWSSGTGVWSPLYVGIVTVMLGIFALRDTSRPAVFWAIAASVGLLYTFGGLTIVYEATYVFFPGVSLFRNQERNVLMVVFALVMLSCHGLAWLTQAAPAITRPLNRLTFLTVGGVGLMFLVLHVATILGVPVPLGQAQAIALTLLIGMGFTVWMGYRGYGSTGGMLVLILLVCVDLLTVAAASPSRVADRAKHYLRLDEHLAAYVIPDPTQIFWRVDGGGGVQGTADYFRIPDIYGNGPLALESIERLFTLPVDRFWEIFAVRYATIIDPPPDHVPLNLIAYGRNASGTEFQVVELLDPRPLAHLVYDYRQAEGSPEFARQIMADNNINLREQAITLYPLPFDLPVTRPTISQVMDVRWVSPEHLTMTVSTGADALLTLSVVNYPGWTARVNGQVVETVNVYAGLIGVPLRAGDNQQVELTFESASLRWGLAISLVSVGVLLIGMFATLKSSRRQ